MNDTTSTPDADFEAAMETYRRLVARVRRALDVSKEESLVLVYGIAATDLEALLAEVER